jgi:hypothetical protein
MNSHRKQYTAYVTIKGVEICIGKFDTLKEAEEKMKSVFNNMKGRVLVK